MKKISLFKDISHPENPEIIDLFDYLEATRSGKWEDIVTRCRILPDDERKAFKQKMPTACLSGEFATRADTGLIEHNNILAMDIDDLDNVDTIKHILEQDKYIFSVFVSTSGTGLRALLKIEKDSHRKAFLGISDYLWTRYNIICDPNGKNVSKPYIVSFDPYLYVNPNIDSVPVFKKYIKETVVKSIPDFVYAEDDFSQVLKYIVSHNINICESYHDWMRIGLAFADKFGASGEDYFLQVSKPSSKYNEQKAKSQYKSCLSHSNSGGTPAQLSTFYYLAKSYGVPIVSERTKSIISATRSGKRAGLKKSQIVDNLAKFSNITGVDKMVDEVFDTFENPEDGVSLIDDLELFIKNNYTLRMNEVTGHIENNGEQMTELDTNTLYIAAKKLFSKLDYNLLVRLLKSDFVPKYNPFFEFFGSDGVAVVLSSEPESEDTVWESPLIEQLASCIKNDNPAYTAFFLRKWLVSIISSAHKVHSPLLLCLTGRQLSGKTEFFRRLMPKELNQYYGESKLDKEKDDEILMTEKLVIMDDELGGKSKKDAEKLKTITSKQYFSLRRPWGTHNESILRLAVLCGTTNYSEMITDTTGNRRIIPIDVHDINKELYNSINKKELFMEMFKLYKAGFDWRINKSDMEYLNIDIEKYETTVSERELIQKFFSPGETESMTTTEIKIYIETRTQQKLGLVALGREMLKLGFHKKSIREGLNSIKKWTVDLKIVDLNEVKNQNPF